MSGSDRLPYRVPGNPVLATKGRRPAIMRPTGTPLVDYTEGVKVTDNDYLYLAGGLIFETHSLCAMPCSIRVLGQSRDIPER